MTSQCKMYLWMIREGTALWSVREESQAYTALCGSRQPPRRSIHVAILLYILSIAIDLLTDGIIRFFALCVPLFGIFVLISPPVIYVVLSPLVLLPARPWECLIASPSNCNILTVASFSRVPLWIFVSIFCAHLHRITARIEFVASANAFAPDTRSDAPKADENVSVQSDSTV